MTTQKQAKLRCCASCEWIFNKGDGESLCPKCSWVSYGARFVFGDKCYSYAITQKPWREKKEFKYSYELTQEIRDTNPIKKPSTLIKLINRMYRERG